MTEVGRQFQSRVKPRGERAHGSNNLDSLFPDGAPTTAIPLPAYNRRREIDRAAVRTTLSSAPTDDQFVDVDTRQLSASQPNVTRGGVKHYLPGGEHETTGRTFADHDNVGNKHPVVYDRDDGSERVLLSGHHRAVAAMIAGRPLRMRRVSGP